MLNPDTVKSFAKVAKPVSPLIVNLGIALVTNVKIPELCVDIESD